MTRRPDPPSGSGDIRIGDVNITGGAFAVGHGAGAENSAHVDQQTVAAAVDEVAVLKALLRERLTGTGPSDPIVIALVNLDQLVTEMERRPPRPARIRELLTSLSAGLAGLAGVGESVHRLVQLAGSAFGLA